MPRQAFSHVRHWVFDLDNTLYPPEMLLFDQIEMKMAEYLKRELGLDHDAANRLRKDYWLRYGTTLAGLIEEHQIDPDGFLDEVHDVDFSGLSPEPDLARAIADLPGRKIVYTNGSAPYARNVLAHRGLTDLFDAVYGFEHAGYLPKPQAEAFRQVFSTDGTEVEIAAMFEDDPRNLKVPHELGMKTVHVAPGPDPQPHIHHHTDHLAQFLTQLV